MSEVILASSEGIVKESVLLAERLSVFENRSCLIFLEKSIVVFAAILGLFFFGDRPDLLSLLGYAVIFAMALLNFRYNKRTPTA